MISLTKPRVLVTKSWNGPRPEPLGPGSMLGPHYISPSPEKPGPDIWSRIESCEKLILLHSAPVISEPDSLDWRSPGPTLKILSLFQHYT